MKQIPTVEMLLKPIKCSASNLQNYLLRFSYDNKKNKKCYQNADKKSMKQIDKIIKQIDKLEEYLERTK